METTFGINIETKSKLEQQLNESLVSHTNSNNINSSKKTDTSILPGNNRKAIARIAPYSTEATAASNSNQIIDYLHQNSTINDILMNSSTCSSKNSKLQNYDDIESIKQAYHQKQQSNDANKNNYYHSVLLKRKNLNLNSTTTTTNVMNRNPQNNGYLSDSECSNNNKYKFNRSLDTSSTHSSNLGYSASYRLREKNDKIQKATAKEIFSAAQQKMYLNETNLKQFTNLTKPTSHGTKHGGSVGSGANDDAQSCISMKTYNENKVKLANQLLNQQKIQNKLNKLLKQHNINQFDSCLAAGAANKPAQTQPQAQTHLTNDFYQNSMHLSYLATPRLPKRTNFSTRIYEPMSISTTTTTQQPPMHHGPPMCTYTPKLDRRQHSRDAASSASYLTWKNFNCNPVPSVQKAESKAPLIGHNDFTSSFRQTHNENFTDTDTQSVTEELLNIYSQNIIQRGRTPSYASSSTPSTPLLSSFTLPRRCFDDSVKHPSAVNPIRSQSRNENIVLQDIGNFSNHLLNQSKETELNEETGIVPLENALLNMNEALRTLTINAQTKQTELEILKKAVTALDTVDVTSAVATATLNISPSSSLSSSSFSNFSKTSSLNSSNATASSVCSATVTETTKNNDKTAIGKKSSNSSFSDFTKRLKNFLLSDKSKSPKSHSLRKVDVEAGDALRREKETPSPIRQRSECVKAKEIETNNEKLANIKSNLEKKLQELEIRNGSDYLLIQGLKNQIGRSPATFYKQ